MATKNEDVIGGCLTLICIGLLFLGCGGCCAIGEAEYGTGYRDCCPQKLSQKGYVWKTWEGEAAMAGARGAKDGAVPNLWEYSVQDPEVLKALQALPDGTIVRLHYRQVWFHRPWAGATDYRVIRVEKLNGAP